MQAMMRAGFRCELTGKSCIEACEHSNASAKQASTEGVSNATHLYACEASHIIGCCVVGEVESEKRKVGSGPFLLKQYTT